uniref:Uncharacterized protein n=1 Tax=Glossina palpalis gambiensis TaxID=67801 RepID=A0A1B0BLE3_9MUSC
TISELIAFDTKRLTGREWNNIKGVKFSRLQTTEMNSKPHFNVVTSQVNKTAEVYLAKKLTLFVVKLPAYLNGAQRQVSKDACRIEYHAYHY